LIAYPESAYHVGAGENNDAATAVRAGMTGTG
jgi:FMN phosphatase YigB (HAD superfamily)